MRCAGFCGIAAYERERTLVRLCAALRLGLGSSKVIPTYEPCSQRRQKNAQPLASLMHLRMPMLCERSYHALVLGLFVQILEVEHVRRVVLIWIMHLNTPCSNRGSPLDTDYQFRILILISRR